MFSDGDAAKKDVELGLTTGALGGIYLTVDMNRLVDVTDQHSEDCASFVSLTAAAIPKYVPQSYLKRLPTLFKLNFIFDLF